MKKYIISFIFLNIFIISFAQINKAEIIYKINLIPNKVKDDKKNHEVNNLIVEEVKNLETKILLNSENSTFNSTQSMEVEDKKLMIRKMAKIIAGVNNEYHYNLKSKKVIKIAEFEGKVYNITSSFNDLKWQLLDKTKKIGNYNCYMAKTTKTFKSRKGNLVSLQVIAWYAPSINIPLGPKNFVGLPGLILELKEGKNKIYYATEININPKKKIKIKKIKNGKEVTEQQFSKITQGAFNKVLTQ